MVFIIFHMKKLGKREIKLLAKAYTVVECFNWDLNPVCL